MICGLHGTLYSHQGRRGASAGPRGHEELVEHLKSLNYEVRDVSESQLGDLRFGISWASRRMN